MNESSLQELINEGKRPILVEFDPPRQTAPTAFLPGARELAEAGADVITIADCPVGRANIDACMLAAKMKREYGIQVLPHMACRDRNLNAIKALLLGLDMEDIRGVLLVTGDPVAREDRDSIRGVFQLTAQTLAQAVSDMAREGALNPFFLCGALNVNARNFDMEIRRARKKEESGIRAFLTQPISSTQAMENVKKARRELKGHLLAGLFPIVSYKNACFLQREVGGMTIDQEIIDSYQGLDRAQGEERAERLCLDTAREARPFVNGFYIMTPFQRIALVKRIIGALRPLR
jgi:homocysteine S-methyltransferase